MTHVSVTLLQRYFLPFSIYCIDFHHSTNCRCMHTVWNHVLQSRLFYSLPLFFPGIFSTLYWINAALTAHSADWGVIVCWWEAAWPLSSTMSGCRPHANNWKFPVVQWWDWAKFTHTSVPASPQSYHPLLTIPFFQSLHMFIPSYRSLLIYKQSFSSLSFLLISQVPTATTTPPTTRGAQDSLLGQHESVPKH